MVIFSVYKQQSILFALNYIQYMTDFVGEVEVSQVMTVSAIPT